MKGRGIIVSKGRLVLFILVTVTLGNVERRVKKCFLRAICLKYFCSSVPWSSALKVYKKHPAVWRGEVVKMKLNA